LQNYLQISKYLHILLSHLPPSTGGFSCDAISKPRPLIYPFRPFQSRVIFKPVVTFRSDNFSQYDDLPGSQTAFSIKTHFQPRKLGCYRDCTIFGLASDPA
jgi:hypothetical protein